LVFTQKARCDIITLLFIAMLKFFFSFLVVGMLGASLLVTGPVLAADGYGLQDTGDAIGYQTTGTSNTIPAMVNKIISVALMVLAFVFFGLTLYAGLRWMTAQGNEEMVTKSKEILKAAIIGLVIVTASYALTKFIFSQLAQ
jgi:hypothetical protein